MNGGRIVRAYIPVQDFVDGLAALQIAEAVFGKSVQERARPQAAGQPIRADAVDRALLLANDLAGITVCHPKMSYKTSQVWPIGCSEASGHNQSLLLELQMKSKFVIALLALSLTAPAFADDDRGRKGGGRDEHSQRGDRGDHGGRDDRRDRGDYRAERGAGPERSFYRGGRLPPQYRNHRYVVQDWRGHRLSSPPRGYQWVQTGNDYVLVAIATGIILQLLLNN